MIPQETIDQIRQASDIAQTIGEYIRLKKRGKNFIALCPFHTEKTPSFTVSPDKQIFYCFGCSKGGNVFTFLMEHENMSFVEAARHLARKANITIQEETIPDFKRDMLERTSFANQIAMDYYKKTLAMPRYKSVLNDYLKGKRKINDDTIESFELGLSGEEWDGLIRYATTKDLSVDDLTAAGLALQSEKTKNYFDRFRQRLMIPIFNLSQKPIAFGGRTLKKGEPAKYINSPETALYIKSNVLYGLNWTKDAIRKEETAIIVEGYFDVISLWQVGIKNVVASSGTAFSTQQARLLARFAKEIYLFFDADSAGQRAALRSVDALYNAGLEVKVIIPPQGEDPDSIATQYGYDKIDELINDAIGFIQFRVQGLDIKSVGIIGKEKLVKELSALGARITDPTRRALFFEEAADKLGVDAQVIRSETARVADDSSIAAPPPRKYNPDEFDFLSLLLNNPGTIDTIFETISPEDFDSKELSRIYAAMAQQYSDTGMVNTGTLISGAQDSAFVSLISRLASRDWAPEELGSNTTKALETIKKIRKKRIRTRLLEELAVAEAAGDQEQANKLLREIRSYGLDADAP